MVKLKKITDNTWLVMTGDGLNRVGLLSEQRDKLVLIAKQARTEFKDRSDVETFFSHELFNQVEEGETITAKVEHYIKGFPVRFDEVHEVPEGEIDTDVPVFTKTPGSKLVFAAGYYCLLFEKAGWVNSFCPKYETLTKYEYKGPYTTRAEMRSVLSKLRRE